MVSTNPVSLEEYLNTDYSPDIDYVDGVLEERNAGKTEHASAQTEIAFYFLLLRTRVNFHVCVEQRVRVSATRIRITGVCVMPGGRLRERVFTTRRFIEILLGEALP